MKTIVIHPEIIAYHNAAFREPRQPINKPLVACAILLPLVALGGWWAGRATNSAASAAPAVVVVARTPVLASLPAIALKPEEAPSAKAEPLPAAVLDGGAIELQTAIDQGHVKAELIGNGRDQLTAEISNPGTEARTVKVSFGQMFESGRNTVVATRTAQIEIAPGKGASLPIPTAATRSANRVSPAGYRLSARTTPKIDLLLTYAQDHLDISPAVLQTAVLALTENLPLSYLCKFTAAGADLPGRMDTSSFRAETPDLLSALSTLREIGVRDRDLAMTVDPQLRIEAMIDPTCRAAAMRYYSINTGAEWNYWKNELLEGDPGTRHFALFGIARFYPEVALEMLPKWAREKRTTAIFRLTAVQALADTHRAEALPMLQKLSEELGRNTELGRAAIDAAQILNLRLEKVANGLPAVAFRGSTSAAAY